MNSMLLAAALCLGTSCAQQEALTGSNLPSQVRISYGEEPTKMMRVVWQTATPTASRVVEYGETSSLGLLATGNLSTYAYQTGAIAEVLLYNLKPDTQYFYRVGDSLGGWSKVDKFRTAPINPREFSFTAYGDHGISPDAIKNVQNVVDENPNFHLLLGDVSYANGNQPIWDEYLKQIEPMTSIVPYMLTLGNHENEEMIIDGKPARIGYVSSLARFASPGYEQWYTFDYGNVRFVSFNSDDYKNPLQLRWLDSTLAEAKRDKRVKWVIVFQHHPLYGTSKGRGDNQGLIKAVGPIFDRHKVDLVLAGHDHHYERQFPLRAGQITSKDMKSYRKGNGTVYVVQGGGGKSLYDFTDPQPEICALREKTTGYVRVTVKRTGALTVVAKRIDKSVIETFEIRP